MRNLKYRLKGAANQFRGNITQASKRAMLRLAIVPPPFRIQVDITDSCNFQCPNCSKWETVSSINELDLDEWNTVFKKIGNIPLLKEISISGGEPFMRTDLLKILEAAKHHQLRIVLITNGWFVNPDSLIQLENIGVDALMVSLNSLDEAIHDETRSMTGSYRRIMDLIHFWCEQPRKTRLCISTVIMESNCCELSLLTDFVDEKGLDGIIFQVLAPNEAHYPFSMYASMPESKLPIHENPLWVRNLNGLDREIKKILCLQKKGHNVLNPPSQLRLFPLYYQKPDECTNVLCLGTLSRMYIDPYGDVRLCYGFPPVGNILRDNPRQLWRGKKARRIRQESRTCKRLCRMLNNNI